MDVRPQVIEILKETRYNLTSIHEQADKISALIEQAKQSNENKALSTKNINMQGKYLITTDNWFYAPDGLKYRSVWGNVKIIEDSVLGIKTNRNSTNWYAYVGNEEKGMIVAGCQIHYAIKCEKTPNTDRIKDISYGDNGFNEFERPSEIYVAQ